MGSILIVIFIFWFWPVRDLRKVRAIKGIGVGSEARLDQDTVDKWKAGRIRAKKLWMGFGTIVIFGVMMNWVVDTFWAADGLTPDVHLMEIFSSVVLLCIFVGLLGFLGSLIYSAWNNHKHLGQLRVSM